VRDVTAINEITEALRVLQQQASSVRFNGVNGGTGTGGNSGSTGNSGSSGSGSGSGSGFFQNTSMDMMMAGIALEQVSAPLVEGYENAIETFGSFDQKMANVNSMMGLSSEKLEKLKNDVLELSKTAPSGPSALADGLYTIMGAGVSTADAMGVLGTASRAAIAGQTDMETSTKALVTVMNAYGLSAKEIPKISDTMFAANQASVATFGELSRSLGTVVGPAAQVGISFEDAISAVAALTNQGISAQRATQNLRNTIDHIIKPLKTQSDMAKELGITWI
jgi:TP901 family phage tail tape measure protein